MTAAYSEFAHPLAVPCIQAARRRISPEAGRALEILSHAIEYLTDEFVATTGSLVATRDRLEVIDVLMSANRRIYDECPAIPPLSRRFSDWLRRLA